jgi:hypothetical protein
MVRSGRPPHVRRSALLLATAMVGLAVLPVLQMPASAACAAPYLKASDRLVLKRGATVTIEGLVLRGRLPGQHGLLDRLWRQLLRVRRSAAEANEGRAAGIDAARP